MKRVCITGASGFIGRRLAARLSGLPEVEWITGMGRNETKGDWDAFLEVDLSGSFDGVRLEGVDTVFHLAGKAHAVSERPGMDSTYHDVIVEGTRKLVDAAERDGVQTLVYLSSVKAMGEDERGRPLEYPLNETKTINPQTPYGQAKAQAEELVCKSRIPRVVVLRPVMVYGPGQKGNLLRMAEAIRHRRFPPVPETHNKRSMVHVDDVVDACLAAAACAELSRGTYILAGPQALSTRELYNTLRREMGMRPVTGSIPVWMLLLGAKTGDMLGTMTRCRMPLDSETVWKLLGNSWYDGSKAARELGIQYENDDRPFLDEDIPPA